MGHEWKWWFTFSEQQSMFECNTQNVCMAPLHWEKETFVFPVRNIQHYTHNTEKMLGAGGKIPKKELQRKWQLFSWMEDWDAKNKGDLSTDSVLGVCTVKGKYSYFFLSFHYPEVLISLGWSCTAVIDFCCFSFLSINSQPGTNL